MTKNDMFTFYILQILKLEYTCPISLRIYNFGPTRAKAHSWRRQFHSHCSVDITSKLHTVLYLSFSCTITDLVWGKSRLFFALRWSSVRAKLNVVWAASMASVSGSAVEGDVIWLWALRTWTWRSGVSVNSSCWKRRKK